MASDQVKDLFKSFWKWRLSRAYFKEFSLGDKWFSLLFQINVHKSTPTPDNSKPNTKNIDWLTNFYILLVMSIVLLLLLETIAKFLEKANQLLLSQNLENEDRINLKYFINDLKAFSGGMNAEGYYFPISFLDGVHIEFERLLDAMKKETETDYLKILERLSQLPLQISQIIEIMREGVKKKMTFHLISLSGVLKQLDLLQLKPEETIFYQPFADIPESVSLTTITKDEMTKQARNVITNKVLPAFMRLKNFLEKEYFQHLRPEIGISSLDKGKELYQMCLNYHLSCTMSPEEIHETGLKEVDRIETEIERIIKSLELNMSVQEFFDYMRKQEHFCYQTVEELLEAYRGIIFNDIEPKIPKLFNYLPKSKLVVKTFPSSSPNSPAAYYFAGTLEEDKPGTFLVNATNLKASPKYTAVTLALHEAMPGHHLQVYYLIESENIPEFRRYLEDRRYTEAPSLFPFNTAYVEGWGLYSEYLGYELGLYTDVYLQYGHLSFEIFRACRLVVDTGMHAFGWSRDQAIDYMLQHSGKAKSEVENEIDRYITWPGQACGYKIGELKIKALRKLAEKSLGSKFDIREFHDVILKSFGPLDLLEERVKEYILLSSS